MKRRKRLLTENNILIISLLYNILPSLPVSGMLLKYFLVWGGRSPKMDDDDAVTEEIHLG